MCSYNRRWTTLLTVVALCAALIAPLSVAAAPMDRATADRATEDFSFRTLWNWFMGALQPASADEGDEEEEEDRIPLEDLPRSSNTTEGDGDDERGPGLDPTGGG